MPNEDLGSLRIKIEMPLTGLRLHAEGAKKIVKDFSGSVLKDVEKAKEGFTTIGMALGAVGAGIGVAAGLAVKTASSFQHQMAEVSTIIEKDSERWTSKLSKDVLQLSRDVPQSTGLLTRGLYDLLSATRPVETAMEELGLASKAAVAGLSDVQSAVNLGTTVMNGMGEAAGTMGEIFDTAFETVRLGVITFPQLAANIGQVIPPASKLGVSMKDVFGSMAFLTKTGLDAAGASVSLAMAFEQIIEKQDKLTGLGIKIFGEKGEFLGFQKVMEQIAGTLTGMTQEERANIFDEMGFDIRASRAITNISMNLEGFKADLADISDASGAMGNAYGKVMDTSEEKTKLLKNQIKALTTEMGDNLLPAFDSVVESLSKVVKGFSDLPDSMKKTIAYGGLVTGALTGIAGASLLIISRLPDTIKGLKALGGMLETVRLLAMEANISLSAIGVTLGVVTGAIIAYHKASKYFAVPINQLNQTLSLQEPILRKLEDAMTAAKEKGIDPYTLAVKDVNKELIYFSKTGDDLNRIFHDNEMGSYSLQGAYEKAKTVIEENRKKLWELQNQTDITTESTDKATTTTNKNNEALGKVKDTLEKTKKLLKEYGLELESLPTFDPTGILGKGMESLYDISKRITPITDKNGLVSPEAAALMQEYLGLIDPYEARIQAINSRYAETEQQLIDMKTAYDKEALAKAKAGEIAQVVADRDSEAITERKRIASEALKLEEARIISLNKTEESVVSATQSLGEMAQKQQLLMASAVPFAGYVNLYDQLADMVEAGDITTQEYIDSVLELNKATEDGIMTNMEYAESFEYIETVKGKVKEKLDEGIGKYSKQIADDWEDIAGNIKQADKEQIPFWTHMDSGINKGISGFNNLYNATQTVFDLFKSDVSGDYGGIKDELDGLQKDYEDTLAGIDEALVKAEKKRDETISKLKPNDPKYREAYQQANKDFEESNNELNEAKTKAAADQKEAELQIIKDFQKSQLSEMARQKFDINKNYETLTGIYKKYGLDTVGLERDRQKQLRDIEIQGYADSLSRIGDYVDSAKSIIDGLSTAWKGLKWAIDQVSGTTPSIPSIPAGTGGGGQYGPTMSEIGTPEPALTFGKVIPLVATGIALYQGYKSIKNNKERMQKIEDDLQRRIDAGELTPTEAQYIYFSSDPFQNSDMDDKIAEKLGKQLAANNDSSKYQEGGVRTKAGDNYNDTGADPPSANLAPPQTININVIPVSPGAYDNAIDIIAQGFKKKGYIVHSKRM